MPGVEKEIKRESQDINTGINTEKNASVNLNENAGENAPINLQANAVNKAGVPQNLQDQQNLQIDQDQQNLATWIPETHNYGIGIIVRPPMMRAKA